MKHLLWLTISIFALNIHAQVIQGRIVDPSKQGIPGVFVHNISSNSKVYSTKDGSYEIPGNIGDSLRFISQGFDTIVLQVANPITDVRLQYSYQELEEYLVEKKRMEKFDAGIIAPIKGVQITTGTNAVVNIETMNGAKSTGNARELFARVPGINIWENDGAGIQIGIGGRGLSPNRAQNFNTRQNGYDISADALGYPESYYTPPTEALSAIEIIRGSASLQFGTQFGGLLNFVIKEPNQKSPFSFTSRNTMGSFGYFGIFNRISGSAGRYEYQVYHQLKKGNGYRENSGFQQNQMFANFGFHATEKLKFSLDITHMDYLAQQAGGLSDFQYKENPLQSFRDRNWFTVNWNMAALHVDYEVSKNTYLNLRTFGMVSQRKTLGFLGKITQQDPGGNRDMIAGDFKNGGAELRLLQKYLFKNLNTRGAFVTGARYYKGFTTSLQGRASDGNNANFSFINPNNLEGSDYSFPSQNVALFAENLLFLGSKWMVNFGVRYENIQSASQGYYKQYVVHPVNGDTLGIYQLESQNTVKRQLPLFGGGITYKATRSSSLYANITQNYRAINFSDIRVTNPNIVIDSAIQDEYGYTSELGIRGTVAKKWTYDLSAFVIYYGNKIGIAPKPGTIYKERTNIGDALNMGIECYTEIDWIGLFKDSAQHQLNQFVNAAYIQSQYVRSKEPNYVGKQVEYVAPIILRSGFKYSYKKFSTQIQFSYTSEQYSDASNAVEPSGDAVIGLVPAYLVGDFSIRYLFKPYMSFEAGVNNLTNENYFTRRATGYPGPGILPADGRNIYFTFQYQFNAKRK